MSGPSPEFLRHMKGMLPSFIKGIAEKVAIGRGIKAPKRFITKEGLHTLYQAVRHGRSRCWQGTAPGDGEMSGVRGETQGRFRRGGSAEQTRLRKIGTAKGSCR